MNFQTILKAKEHSSLVVELDNTTAMLKEVSAALMNPNEEIRALARDLAEVYLERIKNENQ